MFNPFSLKDKIFLVTGASSGIGRETAIAISKMGGKVLITGRNEERLKETFNLLEDKTFHFMELFDFENIEEIHTWLVNVLSKYQIKLNGFVHCAGITNVTPLQALKLEELEHILKVNFISSIILLKSATKRNVSEKGSSYVLVSSVAGLLGEAGILSYSASKAALISAVKTASIELSRFGHRVNTIAPGIVQTSMFQNYNNRLDDNQIEELKKKFLLGIGTPSDVANAAVFLLSDASKWITGTTLIVDGGYSCCK